MFRGGRNRAIAHGISRIPGLKRLPILKVLAIGEIALLARTHIGRLTPMERRRMIELMRKARGRKENLSPDEREELAGLIRKAEPRLFAGLVADKLSPVPLPRRVTHGPRRKRAA